MYTTLIIEGKKYNISESQIRKVYREELQALALERYVPILEQIEESYNSGLITEAEYKQLNEISLAGIGKFISAGLQKLGKLGKTASSKIRLGAIKRKYPGTTDEFIEARTKEFMDKLSKGIDINTAQEQLRAQLRRGSATGTYGRKSSEGLASEIANLAKERSLEAAKAAGAPPQAVAQATQAAQVTPSTTSRAFDTAQNRTDSPLSAPNAAMAALRGTGAAQQAAKPAAAAEPAKPAAAAEEQPKISPQVRQTGKEIFKELISSINPLAMKAVADSNAKGEKGQEGDTRLINFYTDIGEFLQGKGYPTADLKTVTDLSKVQINERKYFKIKEEQVTIGTNPIYPLVNFLNKKILQYKLTDPEIGPLLNAIEAWKKKNNLGGTFNIQNVSVAAASKQRQPTMPPETSSSDVSSAKDTSSTASASTKTPSTAANAGVSQGRNQYNALATDLESIANQEKDPKKKEKLKAVVRAILKTLVGTKDNSFMTLANTQNVEITEAEQPVKNQKIIFDLSTVISKELFKQDLSLSDITEIGNAVSNWIHKNIGTDKDKTFIANMNKKSPFNADEQDFKAEPPPAPADANDEPAAPADTTTVQQTKPKTNSPPRFVTSPDGRELPAQFYKKDEAIRLFKSVGYPDENLQTIIDFFESNPEGQVAIADDNGQKIPYLYKKHELEPSENTSVEKVTESKQSIFIKRGNMFVLRG